MKPLKVLHLTQSNGLRLIYASDFEYTLEAEFLRVHSPSAEVRQHGNPILVPGKLHVKLVQLESVGRYGLKLTFNDGHDSGIYSWSYLLELCQSKQQLWDDYLARLHAAQRTRDPDQTVVQLPTYTTPTSGKP